MVETSSADALQQLTSMGFEEAPAREALKWASNNVELAVRYIIEGPPEHVRRAREQQSQQQQTAKQSQRSTGTSTAVQSPIFQHITSNQDSVTAIRSGVLQPPPKRVKVDGKARHFHDGGYFDEEEDDTDVMDDEDDTSSLENNYYDDTEEGQLEQALALSMADMSSKQPQAQPQPQPPVQPQPQPQSQPQQATQQQQQPQQQTELIGSVPVVSQTISSGQIQTTPVMPQQNTHQQSSSSQRSFTEDPALRRRDKQEDFVGIQNIGNTCWLNALLQTYFMIPAVRVPILQLPGYKDPALEPTSPIVPLAPLPFIQDSQQQQSQQNPIVIEIPTEMDQIMTEATVDVASAMQGLPGAVTQTTIQLPPLHQPLLPQPLTQEQTQQFMQEKSKLQAVKFVRELQRFFAQMMLSNVKAVNPQQLLLSLKDGKPAFQNGNEEDITEFNDLFLEKIEEGLSRISQQQATRADTEIKSLFYGKAEEQLEAFEQDGTPIVVTKEQIFKNFILGVGPEIENLYESMEDGTNATVDFKTEQGHSTFARKTFWFKQAPPIVMFQISRMRYDKQSNLIKKCNYPLQFDMDIYLDRYMESNKQLTMPVRERIAQWRHELANAQAEFNYLTNFRQQGNDLTRALQTVSQYFEELSQKPADGMSSPTEVGAPLPVPQEQALHLSKLILEEQQKVASRVEYLKQLDKDLRHKIKHAFDGYDRQEHRYSLMSIIMHSGLVGGHYWCYMRPFSSLASGVSKSDDKWLKFSDTDVSYVSEETVMKEALGSTENSLSAYCLIYVDLQKCPISPDPLIISPEEALNVYVAKKTVETQPQNASGIADQGSAASSQQTHPEAQMNVESLPRLSPPPPLPQMQQQQYPSVSTPPLLTVDAKQIVLHMPMALVEEVVSQNVQLDRDIVEYREKKIRDGLAQMESIVTNGLQTAQKLLKQIHFWKDARLESIDAYILGHFGESALFLHLFYQNYASCFGKSIEDGFNPKTGFKSEEFKAVEARFKQYAGLAWEFGMFMTHDALTQIAQRSIHSPSELFKYRGALPCPSQQCNHLAYALINSAYFRFDQSLINFALKEVYRYFIGNFDWKDDLGQYDLCKAVCTYFYALHQLKGSILGSQHGQIEEYRYYFSMLLYWLMEVEIRGFLELNETLGKRLESLHGKNSVFNQRIYEVTLTLRMIASNELHGSIFQAPLLSRFCELVEELAQNGPVELVVLSSYASTAEEFIQEGSTGLSAREIVQYAEEQYLAEEEKPDRTLETQVGRLFVDDGEFIAHIKQFYVDVHKGKRYNVMDMLGLEGSKILASRMQLFEKLCENEKFKQLETQFAVFKKQAVKIAAETEAYAQRRAQAQRQQQQLQQQAQQSQVRAPAVPGAAKVGHPQQQQYLQRQPVQQGVRQQSPPSDDDGDDMSDDEYGEYEDDKEEDDVDTRIIQNSRTLPAPPVAQRTVPKQNSVPVQQGTSPHVARPQAPPPQSQLQRSQLGTAMPIPRQSLPQQQLQSQQAPRQQQQQQQLLQQQSQPQQQQLQLNGQQQQQQQPAPAQQTTTVQQTADLLPNQPNS